MSAPTLEAALPPTSVRRAAGWIAGHRALSIAGGFWILFAANFNIFSITYVDDSQRVYWFLQRLVGERHGHTSPYEFGLAIGWLPFWALGKLLAFTGIDSIGGKAFVPGVIALSASVFVLGAAAALVPVLHRLRLPRPTLALVLGVFGTPLWYYGTFNPGHTHAFETMLVSAAVLTLYLTFQRPATVLWLPAVTGGLLAFATAARYFLGPLLLVVVAALAWQRRWRQAAVAAAVPLVSLAILGAVAYAGSGAVLNAPARDRPEGLSNAARILTLDPLTPIRMLFTAHRGLLIWSPVVIVAIVGFVRLLRRRPDQRPFLVTCAAMAVVLVATYGVSPWWDGGFSSYNQRYLTALFPFVVLGLAGILDWRPRLVIGVSAVAVAWTVALGLYQGLNFGFMDRSVTQLPSAVEHGKLTPGLIAYNLYHGSNIRGLIPDPYSNGR